MILTRVQVRIKFMLTIGSMTAKQLKQKMDSDTLGPKPVICARQLRRQLKALVDDGQIEMVGSGNHFEYRIPQEPELKIPSWEKIKGDLLRKANVMLGHVCPGRRQ